MNKVIPILSICVAVFGIVISTLGLIVMIVATEVPQVAILSVPIDIIAFVVSAVSVGMTAFFWKSKLCRAAFFIDLTSLLMSITALLLWWLAV